MAGEREALRPVWAEVDLAAVRENVTRIMEHVAPARLLAVVKADAYGHGAVEVGRAAIEAGASWLGVALVEEGVRLREAGIVAPILLLSQPAPAAAASAFAHDLTPVVYTLEGIETLAEAAATVGGTSPRDVHLKIDTGMNRVGAAPADSVKLAEAISGHSELRLGGVCTHLAVADEPANRYTSDQLAAFDAALADLAVAGYGPVLVHAANTAAALAVPASRYDLVRIGIGIYGVAPSPDTAEIVPLHPVMSVKARVSHVKRLRAGDRISYGLRYQLAGDSWIATVPIGYADGVPRNLGHVGGEVLLRGRRHPIAGTVTMDQLMVDLGDVRAEIDEEVVLVGRQGPEEVTAQEWAARVGTIAYEIVCGIGPRVHRRYVDRRA